MILLDKFQLFQTNIIYNEKILDTNLTLINAGLENDSIIEAEKRIIQECYVEEKKIIPYMDFSKALFKKEINIKFLEYPHKKRNKMCYNQLFGLLKLCLLKEASQFLGKDKSQNLPEEVKYIMQILATNYIFPNKNIKKDIKNVLEKIEGSNILNFSNYVDEVIDQNNFNLILKLLGGKELVKVNDIRYRLSKYNECIKLFNSKFERELRNSIFDYSVISIVIIEREEFNKFEKERNECPNRYDKILYHGTNIEFLSCILTDFFKKSTESCQHGEGIYFTNLIDYAWYYGGVTNRANLNKIPEVDTPFTLIASHVYYDQTKMRQVFNYEYTPKKNEINFAYVNAETETISQPEKNKFYGTEFVVWDHDQICPFLGAKLIRNEYCVIWRDDNFSNEAIYNNEFDEIFKKFLKERMKYIKQMAKYNIYPCSTTNEALSLVERKKYNKIILLSNAGPNLEGKQFVEMARKIIGNNVIVLFLAYNIDHLNWIKNYKNAIFSNEPKFYEDYLQCFNDKNKNNIMKNLKALIANIEKYYDVKFSFDNNFLYYPKFKQNGTFSDLSFNYN